MSTTEEKTITDTSSWSTFYYNTKDGNFSDEAIENHDPVVEDVYVDIYITIGNEHFAYFDFLSILTNLVSLWLVYESSKFVILCGPILKSCASAVHLACRIGQLEIGREWAILIGRCQLFDTYYTKFSFPFPDWFGMICLQKRTAQKVTAHFPFSINLHHCGIGHT